MQALHDIVNAAVDILKSVKPITNILFKVIDKNESEKFLERPTLSSP